MDKKPKLFSSMRVSKSTRDFAAPSKEYPVRKDDYQLVEVIGRGITATVWQAKCVPLDETVAVKILDLERMNLQMDEVMHEAQTMIMHHHPNVLSMYTAFVVDKDLWFVEPYVVGGSVFNIMKYKYPNGLEERLIAIIMKEVAKALEYVHRSNHIHRDVKAGNVLIDADGSVYLADFGVAATIERGGSWGNDKIGRNTFVGTPCWMAPEVVEQTSGYDVKADIWSFGITMLELAHGHAPFSNFSPLQVLLKTTQEPPPTLEEESGERHFSKHMRELVADCLQKDPTKRPSASQVLEYKFFKNVPDTRYLATHLVDDLPSLSSRVKILEDARRDSMSEEESYANHMKTKEEYVRGVSGWNFGDLHAFRKEKENVQRTPTIHETKEGSVIHRETFQEDAGRVATEKMAETTAKAEMPTSPKGDIPIASPKKSMETKDSGHKTGVEKNGKQSRFSVTTESTVARKPMMDALHGTESSKTAESVGGPTGDQSGMEHKQYTIGRFKVHDQVLKKDDSVKKDDPPKDKPKSTAPSINVAIPPATVLMSQLQGFLSTHRCMYQAMEQIVDALKEAEKGHQTPLQTLSAAPCLESHEALQQRVKDLETENKTLKERIHRLKQQRSQVANGPTSQDKH